MPASTTPHASSCALLVLSCDAYSDLWPPFFNLLDRWWPDVPFPVYLGAGSLECNRPGITVLKSDGGRDWSVCLRDYLDQLEQRHILVTLDDFFLRGFVSNAKVLHCLEFARVRNAVHVRLMPRPGPTDALPDETLVGECAADSPYRLCTQAAIWDRRVLRDLLRPGESIWEFEHKGNVRASALSTGFFSARWPVLPYRGLFAHHVVEKGKWLPHEKWIFRHQDIGCDFSLRGTLPWRQTLFYHLAQSLDRILDVFPWRTKVRIKHGIKIALRPFFRLSIERLGQTPPASQPPP